MHDGDAQLFTNFSCAHRIVFVIIVMLLLTHGLFWAYSPYGRDDFATLARNLFNDFFFAPAFVLEQPMSGQRVGMLHSAAKIQSGG
jgi:hypothetical protein